MDPGVLFRERKANVKKTQYQEPLKRIFSRWTASQHESVMFAACPKCRGRVFWGDADTRFLIVTGIRGSCVMCGREWYTSDLLSDIEEERIRQALEAA